MIAASAVESDSWPKNFPNLASRNTERPVKPCDASNAPPKKNKRSEPLPEIKRVWRMIHEMRTMITTRLLMKQEPVRDPVTKLCPRIRTIETNGRNPREKADAESVSNGPYKKNRPRKRPRKTTKSRRLGKRLKI